LKSIEVLTPPNPKAFLRAYFMDYSKGYFFTKFNVGISYESSKFKIGGALLFRRERIQKMDSIEPAAPKVWPMLLLVAEILILSINLRSF